MRINHSQWQLCRVNTMVETSNAKSAIVAKEAMAATKTVHLVLRGMMEDGRAMNEALSKQVLSLCSDTGCELFARTQDNHDQALLVHRIEQEKQTDGARVEKEQAEGRKKHALKMMRWIDLSLQVGWHSTRRLVPITVELGARSSEQTTSSTEDEPCAVVVAGWDLAGLSFYNAMEPHAV